MTLGQLSLSLERGQDNSVTARLTWSLYNTTVIKGCLLTILYMAVSVPIHF